MKYTIGYWPQYTGSLKEWTFHVRDDTGTIVMTSPANKMEVVEKLALFEAGALRLCGHEVEIKDNVLT